MGCKICNSATQKFGEAMVMGKHKAEYDQCVSCGFISVRQPHWLAEAYSSAITSSDLGTVSRANQYSLVTKALVDLFFHSTTTYLDYGAGYGMFVRRMRDLGYNFFAYDLHCQNLFASQFQLLDLKEKNFDLATAFEVFEHLEDPKAVFDLLLTHADQLLLTTDLIPEPTPALPDWWYYGLEHGQHLNFYTIKALQIIAETHGRFFYTNGTNLHFLSRKKISKFWFRKVTTERNSQWLGLWRRRPTLLIDDFVKNRAAILAKLGYVESRSMGPGGD